MPRIIHEPDAAPVRPSRRALLAAAAGAAAAMAGAASKELMADPEQEAGFVYVESNVGAPGGNAILAFRRDAAGALTALPRSPFPAGGTGVFATSLALGPFDSDQN